MTDEPDPKPVWSPETRTWVSLLLFAHLFALVVAVTSYTRPSLLQVRLHQLFEPYLRNLHLTAVPYSYPFARYHLAHGLTSDTDFSLELDIPRAGGKIETLRLPEPMQPLVRLRRYQALANAAGTLASGESNDAYTSILPKVIAGSLLARAGAAEGTLRIRAYGLPGLTDEITLSTLRAAAERNVNTIYEAQAFVSPTGVELLRKSTTLEVAPVERGRRAAPGPSQPQSAPPNKP